MLLHDCFIGLHGSPPVLCPRRLNDTYTLYEHLVLMQLPYRHKSIYGDASGLISTANVIISQSRSAQTGTIPFGLGVPSARTSHK